MSRRWITKPTPGSNGEYCTIVDAIEGRAVARHVKPADALEIIGLESLSADLNGIAMEWERSMMAAIGEDGVKSVSDAIKRLRAERSMLIDALRDIYNRHLNPGPVTGVDAIFCFRKAQTALDKIERR